MQIKLCSYNCQSLKSSVAEICSLCSEFDIIFIQETWLAKFELDILNTIHGDFFGYGISAFDSSAGLLRGRPFGGLAVLWRKSLQSSIKVELISDCDRLMQINILSDKGLITIFNVYMPTDYRDENSLEEYCMLLGKLQCLLSEVASKSAFCAVICDFNANSNGSRFYTELFEFCDETR